MADTTPADVTNEKLSRIARLSANRLRVLFSELEDDILMAMRKTVEQAQESKKEKISFSFTHTIKLDLCKDTQEDSLALGLRLKSKMCGEIPDDAQLEMEFAEWLEFEGRNRVEQDDD